MPKRSAGLLIYRRSAAGLEVMLVHPGGPLWSRKDAGAWSLPKGEYHAEEDPLETARREFLEETGFPAPDGRPLPLGEARLPSGKIVTAWAIEGNLNIDVITSNSFTMEWPPRSGKICEFPEVDRAGWFTLEQARDKIQPGQLPLLEKLAASTVLDTID
jgi:predicted NUDIX family NTP pyrophosphohydrolase